ncbi:hypothetical protein EYC58_05780 [Candidatus Saccharibacteria bacterium]|nr:MAG: hypothetical protein EYC58_05780 [Candidatus Saccharibacteria bacterium]
MSFGMVAASYVGVVQVTPADVPGLALWLKADTITGLSDGANVTSWQDTTNSLTALPPSTPPTFAANSAPSGLSSVRFATSGTPLQVGSTATPTDTLTYVVVAKLDALLAEAVLIGAFQNGAFYAAMRNSSMASVAPGVAWFPDGPAGAVDTNWHVYVWTYDNASDTITYTVDAAASSVTTAVGPMVSDVYFIGQALSGWGAFGGTIAEIATYGRVLSPTEINTLTAGLADKWGL